MIMLRPCILFVRCSDYIMGRVAHGKILTLFSQLSYLHHDFPDRKLSDLIGNQSLDSDVYSHHEFPDLIFSKSYGKFNAVNVSRSMGSTRYDSIKDIKTVYPGTVFLCDVNIS